MNESDGSSGKVNKGIDRNGKAKAFQGLITPVQRQARRNSTNTRNKLVSGHRPNPRLIRLLILAAVVLAVVAGVALGLHFYFKDRIQVVDLTSWKIADTRLWAANNNLILREDEKYDDKVEAGRVISQEAVKGSWLQKDSFIGVIVSMGSDPSVTLPLPELMAMTKDGIDVWVAQNLLTKISVIAQYNDTVAKGRVISYEIGDPSVVDKVRRDTPIRIVVSKGKQDPDAAAVSLPDFAGKTLDDCMEFTNKNGIVLQVDKEYSDLIPAGDIIRQSVKVGVRMKSGETLTIVISMGKAVLVPDFTLYTKQDASAEAQKLNMSVSITERYSSSIQTGKLISQSISPNAIYNGGDSVSLVYSLGNQVSVGSFVGQGESAIKAWAKGVNDQGASITIKTTYTQNSASKDRILSQDRQNMSVDLKATISITVSLGMKVQVPDFIAPAGSGYGVAVTMEKAMAMCERLGIVPVFVESKKSGRLPGEVWYQSIAAGKRISQGTTITLKYTPNTVVVTVTDFTGMTKESILEAGYDKKLDITFTVASSHTDGYDDAVYRQSISSGTKVASGSVITLTISPSTSS